MDFKDIVMNRHAVRKFDDRKVSEEDVERLKEIIRHAPSSYNLQPWKIKVISDKETLEKLAPATWNQPQMVSCSHLLVFCADTDIKSKIDHLERIFIAKGIPIEVIGMMRNFEAGMNEEQKKAWAQRQLYLALGNALNGAKSLGFDSSPMEGFMPSEYSKILNLPEHIIPTALCAIGYPVDAPRDKLRFPTEDVFF